MRFPPPKAGPVLVLDPDVRRWRPLAEAAGWTVAEVDELPEEPWNLRGTLACTADPSVAALALARGGGAALLGSPSPDLEADARRIGAAVWPDDVPVARAAPDETELLLEHLAAGQSVAAAARQAHISLRTAQRRLDGLRRKYGVRTTAGVVRAWAREQR